MILVIGLFAVCAYTQDDAAKSLYKQKCGSCHPKGGNTMKSDKPLKSAVSLKSLGSFIAYVRKPYKPMPAFPEFRLSDKQAKEIYDYILKENKNDWK